MSYVAWKSAVLWQDARYQKTAVPLVMRHLCEARPASRSSVDNQVRILYHGNTVRKSSFSTVISSWVWWPIRNHSSRVWAGIRGIDCELVTLQLTFTSLTPEKSSSRWSTASRIPKLIKYVQLLIDRFSSFPVNQSLFRLSEVEVFKRNLALPRQRAPRNRAVMYFRQRCFSLMCLPPVSTVSKLSILSAVFSSWSLCQSCRNQELITVDSTLLCRVDYNEVACICRSAIPVSVSPVEMIWYLHFLQILSLYGCFLLSLSHFISELVMELNAMEANVLFAVPSLLDRRGTGDAVFYYVVAPPFLWSTYSFSL